MSSTGSLMRPSSSKRPRFGGSGHAGALPPPAGSRPRVESLRSPRESEERRQGAGPYSYANAQVAANAQTGVAPRPNVAARPRPSVKPSSAPELATLSRLATLDDHAGAIIDVADRRVQLGNFPAPWVTEDALPQLPQKMRRLLKPFGKLDGAPACERHPSGALVVFADFVTREAACKAVAKLSGLDIRTNQEKQRVGHRIASEAETLQVRIVGQQFGEMPGETMDLPAEELGTNGSPSTAVAAPPEQQEEDEDKEPDPFIVVRGFPASWEDTQVKLIFAVYGGVANVTFLGSATSRLAYVKLKDLDKTQRAAEQLHNQLVGDGDLIEKCTLSCEVHGSVTASDAQPVREVSPAKPSTIRTQDGHAKASQKRSADPAGIFERTQIAKRERRSHHAKEPATAAASVSATEPAKEESKGVAALVNTRRIFQQSKWVANASSNGVQGTKKPIVKSSRQNNASEPADPGHSDGFGGGNSWRPVLVSGVPQASSTSLADQVGMKTAADVPEIRLVPKPVVPHRSRGDDLPPGDWSQEVAQPQKDGDATLKHIDRSITRSPTDVLPARDAVTIASSKAASRAQHPPEDMSPTKTADKPADVPLLASFEVVKLCRDAAKARESEEEYRRNAIQRSRAERSKHMPPARESKKPIGRRRSSRSRSHVRRSHRSSSRARKGKLLLRPRQAVEPRERRPLERPERTGFTQLRLLPKAGLTRPRR